MLNLKKSVVQIQRFFYNLLKMINFKNIQNIIDQLPLRQKITDFGYSTFKTPLSFTTYNNWIENNQHAGMDYLKDHLFLKENYKNIHPQLNSSMSFTFLYQPTPFPHEKEIPARIAMYAQNFDYHFWIKDILNEIILTLQNHYPNEIFIPFVDSGPIMERDLAYQASLGWFGKNSCLINSKYGSLFFISEIMTSLKFEIQNEPSMYHPDLCGKCTKCIDHCPTQAIQNNKTLVSEKCISYLTIESKDIPPREIRAKIGDWFFGCDICQTVCPWNQKQFKLANLLDLPKTQTSSLLSSNHYDKIKLIEFYRFLFSSSHKKIQNFLHATPLLRAKPLNLKRNALINIGNLKLHELKDDIVFIKNKHPELSELADWCLEQF